MGWLALTCVARLDLNPKPTPESMPEPNSTSEPSVAHRQEGAWQRARHEAVEQSLIAQREHEVAWWKAETEAERRRLMAQADETCAAIRAECAERWAQPFAAGSCVICLAPLRLDSSGTGPCTVRPAPCYALPLHPCDWTSRGAGLARHPNSNPSSHRPPMCDWPRVDLDWQVQRSRLPAAEEAAGGPVSHRCCDLAPA